MRDHANRSISPAHDTLAALPPEGLPPQATLHQPPAQQPPPLPRASTVVPTAVPAVHSLVEVLMSADTRIQSGDLGGFLSLPTGFEPLDQIIGGGLRAGELLLLGGAPGIGKTVWALQAARNLAFNNEIMAVYVSFEHDEEHLLSRLLCQETIQPSLVGYQVGLKLKDLFQEIASRRQKGPVGLYEILQGNPKAARALMALQRYAHKLSFVRGNTERSDVDSLEQLVAQVQQSSRLPVVLFVDYLQKIPVRGGHDEGEKTAIAIHGLKDLALRRGVPVVVLSAVDREGLKARRLHLHHFRGNSAIDHECDVAIVLNNKWRIVTRQHVEYNAYKAEAFRGWIVFTVEKNRAGLAPVDVEFALRSEYFCFNPQGRTVEQDLLNEQNGE